MGVLVRQMIGVVIVSRIGVIVIVAVIERLLGLIVVAVLRGRVHFQLFAGERLSFATVRAVGLGMVVGRATILTLKSKLFSHFS